MSSSIADTIGKQKRRSVKKLEKFQGFDFANGLASISRATRDRQGPIGDLYESLKSINVMRDISLHQLRREARELFDLLGPHLWPRDTSTAWWLLKPPNSDYPRYLYYDDREDREQLWEYFSEMVQEKRLNHEDHVSRCTKSRGQSEDSTSFSNEAGFADGVRYERAPTASMRRGSAYAAVQSPAAQSEAPTDNVQLRTRASANPLKRSANEPANELLQRMGLQGLLERNKRPANHSPETMRMSRLHDRDKRPAIGSSSWASWPTTVSPVTSSVALGSHAGESNPRPSTSRLQAGQADAPNNPSTTSGSELRASNLDARSATPEPQRSTLHYPSTTPGPQTCSSNPLAKVQIFLEVQRSTGAPKKCWSIPVEEMDIFTGELVRTRLQKFKLLQDNEKVLLVHVRPEDGGRSIQGLGVETTFIMPWDCPEQKDWDGMLEGLKDFYAEYPTALDLKLRATLEVEADEAY